VPCRDEILQQLDGIAFRDENMGKKKRKKWKTGVEEEKYFLQTAVMERKFVSAQS